MGDEGLEKFVAGFTTPLTEDNPSSDPILLCLLRGFLPLRTELSDPAPVVAILDLSYNHLTSYQSLQPFFQSPEIGLSELFLNGNKYALPLCLCLCLSLSLSLSLSLTLTSRQDND
jgi:hypothetical protein